MQTKTILNIAKVKPALVRLLILIVVVVWSNSCVVNRKYQYLQKDDVNVKTDAIQKDTVLRSYDLSNFEYKLQPEDILSIRFYSLTPEEYDFFSLKNGGSNNYNQFQNGAAGLVNGYLVDEDGSIEFPVVGKVEVSGLTIFQAQNKILKVAKQYLKDPVVEVRLLNFRFSILGEVNAEGTYTSLNNRITMIEALGLAGGLTDLANKSTIKIIRQGKGKADVYYLNLLDEDFINSPYYYVNQNDIIIVPPLKQRPYQVYFGKNLALVISSVSLLLLVINLSK